VIDRAKVRLFLAYTRARGAVRQAARALAERRERRELAEFYRGLPRREAILYMFFTADLLHWLDRALAFVPADVNLVLIGSDLSPGEISWIRSRYRHPFHHIRSRLDDNSVLELVFQMAEHDFGWLHVDCFVLDPRLFGEMAALAPDVVANCIWSHPVANGTAAALHSAFVFLNFRVIQEVRARGIEVSPCTYSYGGSSIGRTVTHRKLYSRVPTRRQVGLLRRVLPPGVIGLPQYPLRNGYFQVLVLFQLVANALGYRLHHVRELLRDGSGSASSFSNEIVHINGVATYKRYKEDDGSVGGRFYPVLLQADYALLASLCGQPAPNQSGRDPSNPLPPRYHQLLAELESELARLGIPPRAVRSNLRGFLAERGIGEDSLDRILGRDEPAGEPTAAARSAGRASA
jgi:hypothetical protein